MLSCSPAEDEMILIEVGKSAVKKVTAKTAGFSVLQDQKSEKFQIEFFLINKYM